MGAAMFGLHAFPDDPDWTGWWGDEPPFRVPVLVLTHALRPAVTMANGTSFEFLSVTAAAACGGKNQPRLVPRVLFRGWDSGWGDRAGWRQV